MGREVRRVPKGWQHPKDAKDDFDPLMPGDRYQSYAKKWVESLKEKGLQETIESLGLPPDMREYMPVWTEAEADHLMMYENTSEGTPISPAFKTPEELARWLADNGASTFASMTGTYEQWLNVCRGAWAPSAVLSLGPEGGELKSGVEAMEPR